MSLELVLSRMFLALLIIFLSGLYAVTSLVSLAIIRYVKSRLFGNYQTFPPGFIYTFWLGCTLYHEVLLMLQISEYISFRDSELLFLIGATTLPLLAMVSLGRNDPANRL